MNVSRMSCEDPSNLYNKVERQKSTSEVGTAFKPTPDDIGKAIQLQQQKIQNRNLQHDATQTADKAEPINLNSQAMVDLKFSNNNPTEENTKRSDPGSK